MNKSQMGPALKTAIRHRQAPLAAIVIALCLILSLTTSTFSTVANIRSIVLGAVIDLVLIAGQTIVIIGGGFDLSIGSILGLSAVIVGLLIGAGAPWWLAALVAIAASVICGLFNGFLIAKLAITPLIGTLGTLFVFQGIALVITSSETVYATGTPLVDAIGQANALGVPIPVWFAIAILTVAFLVMRSARFGREVFLVGGNREAARLVGINVQRIQIASYMLMGLLAGIAGVLAIGRVGTANSDTGVNEPLTVIAAVVLGGASLAGGEGSIIGATMGVLLIGIVQDAVVLLNVPVFWQQLLIGLVLIVAVAANVLNSKIRHWLFVRATLGPNRDPTTQSLAGASGHFDERSTPVQ